jgi:GNAT superfamily N-acetyltransferase
MQIVNVSGKGDLKKFIFFPFDLYKSDPHWVPPLISDQIKFFDPTKNPYFEHSNVQLFLVVDGEKVLGRISAQTNAMHNSFHEDKKGFFGFFECIDDQSVANMLFDKAHSWLREKGADMMSGPYNFSTNDECGLLVDGFDSIPFVMMPHSHSYYQKLYEGYGLVKAMDMYAWYLHTTEMPKFLAQIGEKIQKNTQIHVRCLDKKNLKRDVQEVFKIYQLAWEKNWGFVPMTKKEFDHLVETLLPIVDPDLVFIAECDGQPAGFSVALPNYNIVLQKMKGKINPISLIKMLYYKNKLSALRVITMGVIAEYQGKGIDSLFYYHTWKNGLAKGFNAGEFSWVLETNTMMNRIARHLGATIHKTYRIYEK